MNHAAPEYHEREEHALLQEEWLIEGERGAEQYEDHCRPRGGNPLDGKLEIKERHDGGGAQVGHKNVEVQAAVLGNVFFLSRQLRVHEIQDESQRKNRIHARAPELARLACRKIGEEDARECRDESDVRLIAELGDLAENAVFK